LSKRHIGSKTGIGPPGDVDMVGSSQRLKLFASVIAAAATLAVGGCADGVELNGKVFDLLGVSPAALEASRREPKLAERAPLVMPPNANRLPDPNSGQAGGTEQASWPTDPEQAKLAAAQERERLHLAYCRGDIQWKERALRSKDGSGTNLSPYGPCPSLFSGVTSGINKN
jgi:hypothetical protein